MTVWVSMLHLSRCWALGVDSKLEPKFTAEFESRVKTSSYEAACWGALAKCGLTQQADHLKSLVRQLETRDIGGGALEINLGSDGLKLLSPSQGTAATGNPVPGPRASQSQGKPESRPRAQRTPERRAVSPAPSGAPPAPTTARTPAPPPRPRAAASTVPPGKTSPSLLDRMREQARRKLQAQSRPRAG